MPRLNVMHTKYHKALLPVENLNISIAQQLSFKPCMLWLILTAVLQSWQGLYFGVNNLQTNCNVPSWCPYEGVGKKGVHDFCYNLRETYMRSKKQAALTQASNVLQPLKGSQGGEKLEKKVLQPTGGNFVNGKSGWGPVESIINASTSSATCG